MKRILPIIFLTCAALAQDKPADKPIVISGTAFLDAYAVVSHHDPVVDGKNGFWFRRIYLTADHTISDQLSARLRFEMNQAGDFRSNTTLEPFVKDAWVKWHSSSNVDVILGLSPTPSIDTVERVWGYRSVEKTPLDLYRIYSTRDLGVAVAGAFGRMRYHVQAGNGAGTGSETNEGKRVAATVSLAPMKGAIVELYGDTEDRPGDTDRTTLHIFGGLEQASYRVGAEYAHQHRENTGDLDLASVFATYNLNPRFALLGRIDRLFDPNPEGDRIAYLPMDPTKEATTVIAGVDWKLHKNLSIIPNVELVKYDHGGDDDLLGRVTASFSF